MSAELTKSKPAKGDPVHLVAAGILETSDDKDASALAKSLQQNHSELLQEIRDLKQRLFEKSCELAELKADRSANEVAKEQISDWLENSPQDSPLPISDMAELQNFRDLAPSSLKRLAVSSKLSKMDWRSIRRKAPWKIGVWSALRRYRRRTG